jgi:hypothetical protein
MSANVEMETRSGSQLTWVGVYQHSVDTELELTPDRPQL